MKSRYMLLQNPLTLLNSSNSSVGVLSTKNKTVSCSFSKITCPQTSRSVSCYSGRPLLQERLQSCNVHVILQSYPSLYIFKVNKWHTPCVIYTVLCGLTSLLAWLRTLDWDAWITVNICNLSQENNNRREKSSTFHNCVSTIWKSDADCVSPHINYSFIYKIDVQNFRKKLSLNFRVSNDSIWTVAANAIWAQCAFKSFTLKTLMKPETKYWLKMISAQRFTNFWNFDAVWLTNHLKSTVNQKLGINYLK